MLINYQIASGIVIVLIQIYRKNFSNTSLIKAAFNYLTFQIYLIIFYAEFLQVLYFNQQKSLDKVYYLHMLENYLLAISMSVFIVILWILLFLRQSYISSKRKFFWATAQTFICQLPFFLPSLINKNAEWKLSYILGILILSAVSSLKPIMQVLLENPLNSFTSAIKGISEPTPEQIPFRYTEIQTDEELAELREEDIKTPIWSKIKKCLKFMVQLFKVIYSTIQLLLALVLIFGFICVFIQVANPESSLLSQLNAINALQQFDGQSQTEEWISIIVISLFKYMFVIIMYFQSNLCIDYNKKTGLVALINNIIVIIRKNLLYFTLIGLLTTLYPNLTFTINNSECFKDIHYQNSQYISKQQKYEQSDNCPVTLVYLETIRLFESNVSVVIGLAVLSMYLVHACYLVIIKVIQPARMM